MIVLEKKYAFCVAVLLLLMMLACSNHGRYPLPGFTKYSEFPEGLDSLTVARSDSIIQFLFVDFNNERRANELTREGLMAFEQADSLWKECQRTRSDSTRISITIAADSNAIAPSAADVLSKKVINYLQQAEKSFLQAIKLNPFPLTIKDGLVQTYLLWAAVEKPELFYEKAITLLTDMVASEKSDHLLFYRLGDCYFRLGKWELALENYRQAEKIYQATSVFTDTSVFDFLSDYTRREELYFNYLYSQAVVLARLYRSAEALRVVSNAKEIAPTLELKQLAERFQDWINWDRGNIYTAEQKNQILALIKQEQYQEAATRFESLKSQLSDSLAIDEIEWRIAGLEFRFLNKKPAACQRLLKVINRYRTRSIHSPSVKSNYEQYITDCGTMHFHLAMEFIEKADFKQAQKYLEQGSQIDWYGNYKCSLELARLNRHNPQTSLDIVEKVLRQQNQLSTAEKLAALEIKLSALRKLGPQFHEQAQQTYNSIRELQKK
ncbi:MAG: hypothetical protein ONB27_11970 [candidate division KSB1 bacterium]|nr:hypothetical protein [candidate division KSB1 bacterium]